MKYLVIYCGGTIGMVMGKQGLRTDKKALLEALNAFSGSLKFDVHVCEPLIDSSAMTLANWRDMVALITEKSTSYAGFLLIHGTDTMAYSASLLAFALRGLNKPVVLTGSQFPLLAPNSDALGNLNDAFKALVHPSLKEVVVIFNHKVLRGVGSKKVDAIGVDAFATPHMQPLAGFELSDNWLEETLRLPERMFTPINIDVDVKVAVYMLVPGVSVDLITESLYQQQSDAAILLTYGNGNAPSDASFIKAIESYVAAGKVLVNVSQVLKGKVSTTYAQGAPLFDAGVLSGGTITLEAAVAKLTVLLSQKLSVTELKQQWQHDLIGEFAISD